MQMSFIAQLNTQNRIALQEGLKIVRKVVAANPNPAGLTTAELFKLSVKEEPSLDVTYTLSPQPRTSYGKGGYQRTPGPLPPHPKHPIRSMTYAFFFRFMCICNRHLWLWICSFLKNAVLPIMEGNKEIKIVRSARIPFHPAATHRASSPLDKGKRKNKPVHVAATPAPVTTWVWKAVDQSTLPKREPPQPPRKLFGVEVGVGEDWSHLNKRRRRARVGKVKRDLAVMKVVEGKRRALEAIREEREKTEKMRERDEEARRESVAKTTSRGAIEK